MVASACKDNLSKPAVGEDDILQFVRGHLPSTWTLELLLLLQRERQAAWTCEALVRELRATLGLVTQNLGVLTNAGLVAETDDGRYAYRPQSDELAALVDGLEELYARKPVTVLRTILTTPNEKIRLFADAFLFKKPGER
jgi:hypothetical protein